MMLKLEGLIDYKTVDVNGKSINIPKMSLYHYNLLKDIDKNPDNVTRLIANSIHHGLTKAERDLVLLHVLAYNGKLKNNVTVNNVEFSIDDVVTCQQLKFNIDNYEFRFRSPKSDELFSNPEDILNTCIVSTKRDSVVVDNPDFYDMPAYVKEWIELIITTVKISSSDVEYHGIGNIMELFSEH